MINFVSDLQQLVGGFLWVLQFPPSINVKIGRHDITEILLKLELNIINP
jgi:hypothetical protein